MIDEVTAIDTGKSKFTPKKLGVYEILGSTSVIGYDDSYDYEGDFLLTARVGANAGELYRYSGKVKISDNTVFIKGEQLDFIYYALLHFDIKRLSFGTGQPLVKASELKVQDIMMPVDDDERSAIGTYFSNLDNLITLHQWKHYRIKKIINSAWEQRKVSELLYLSNEKNDGSYTRDDVLAASLGTELQKKHIYFGLRATDESVKNYKVVLPKDVIYTKSPIKGFPNGIIRTNKGETGIVPTLYCVYHSIDTINPSIIQAYFESKERLDAYLVPLVNIGARNNVNITDKEFINGSICIPKNETEQNRIVDLLEKISNLITLHQQKYKSLKKLKKFMVKNMFLQVKCKNTEKDR